VQFSTVILLGTPGWARIRRCASLGGYIPSSGGIPCGRTGWRTPSRGGAPAVVCVNTRAGDGALEPYIGTLGKMNGTGICLYALSCFADGWVCDTDMMTVN
jgi:hypothetical protein